MLVIVKDNDGSNINIRFHYKTSPSDQLASHDVKAALREALAFLEEKPQPQQSVSMGALQERFATERALWTSNVESLRESYRYLDMKIKKLQEQISEERLRADDRHPGSDRIAAQDATAAERERCAAICDAEEARQAKICNELGVLNDTGGQASGAYLCAHNLAAKIRNG